MTRSKPDPQREDAQLARAIRDAFGEAEADMPAQDVFAAIERRFARDIREKIATGVASLRAGRSVDGEEVLDRIEEGLSAPERQGTRRATD